LEVVDIRPLSRQGSDNPELPISSVPRDFPQKERSPLLGLATAAKRGAR